MDEPGLPQPLALYHLEGYLFDTVGPRFREQGYLDAFDLFSIVIWKAERAKSKVAAGLLSAGAKNLDAAARDFTSHLSRLPTHKDRLLHAVGTRGFGLPMASAVLTVFYPEAFTVYDVRVCATLQEMGLGSFGTLGNRSRRRLWEGYEAYCRAVREGAPKGLSLRDCDRWLWAMSFRSDLLRDIDRQFRR